LSYFSVIRSTDALRQGSTSDTGQILPDAGGKVVALEHCHVHASPFENFGSFAKPLPIVLPILLGVKTLLRNL
jgi:hypothetical protein